MLPLGARQSSVPIRTARTHEENQERAYTAASRRSDSSLEARVISARRAPGIHKRGTGRYLRITEKDVLNEEVYEEEEEDDDPALQYQRLTASQRLGSAGFDSQAEAYLINQLAMRSAIYQMVNAPSAPQCPNASQPAQQHIDTSQPPLVKSQKARSPTQSHRSAPYYIPYHTGFAHMYGSAYAKAVPIGLIDFPRVQTNSPFTRTESFGQGRMANPADVALPPMHADEVYPDRDSEGRSQHRSLGHPKNNFTPLCCLNAMCSTATSPIGAASFPSATLHSMFGSSLDNYLSNSDYARSNIPVSPMAGQPTTNFHTWYAAPSPSITPDGLDIRASNMSAMTSTVGPALNGITKATSVTSDFKMSPAGMNPNGFTTIPTAGMRWEGGAPGSRTFTKPD